MQSSFVMVAGIIKELAPTHMCKGMLKEINALDDDSSCMDIPDSVSKQLMVFYMSGSLSFSTNSIQNNS
jgi:hypothetical protein